MNAVRALWPNLPVLLVGSVLAGTGWTIAMAFTGWAAIVAAGLLAVPPLAALTAGCGLLLRDEHFGIGTLIRTLPSAYGTTIKITALPLTLITLTAVAFAGWQQSGSGWLLPSVAVGALSSAVAIFVSVVAVPYALRTGSSVKDSWLVAAYIASRRPIPVLGTISAVVLAVLAAQRLSFALIILLPGLLAMMWAAAVSSATSHSQQSLALKGSR